MKHETAHGAAMAKAADVPVKETDVARRDIGTFEPMTFLHRFGDEMDRVFSNFGLGRRLEIPRMFTRMDLDPFLKEAETAMWAPKVEMFEKDGKLCVHADLPGVRKEDVTVEVRDNTLFIKGERKHEHEEKKEGFFRTEKSYGSFFRAFRLPEHVDVKKVKADLKDGVLNILIDLPVKEEPKARRIDIA